MSTEPDPSDAPTFRMRYHVGTRHGQEGCVVEVKPGATRIAVPHSPDETADRVKDFLFGMVNAPADPLCDCSACRFRRRDG